MRRRRSDESRVGCEIAPPSTMADGKIIVSPATTEVNSVNPSAIVGWETSAIRPQRWTLTLSVPPQRRVGTSPVLPTVHTKPNFPKIFAALLNREGNSTFCHCTFLAHRGPLLQLRALIPLCHVPIPQTGEEDATNTSTQPGKWPHEHNQRNQCWT